MANINIADIIKLNTLNVSKPIYFLGSVVNDDNKWDTRNINLDVLSNGIYEQIIENNPGLESIEVLNNNIEYLGTLSNELSDAADFANNWKNKLTTIFYDYRVNDTAITSYVDNTCTNKATNIANTLVNNAKNEINDDIYTLNDTTGLLLISANDFETRIKILENSTSGTDTDKILLIKLSTDIYGENFTPGGDYNILSVVKDVEEDLYSLINFIDPNDEIDPNIITFNDFIKNIVTTNTDIRNYIIDLINKYAPKPEPEPEPETETT